MSCPLFYTSGLVTYADFTRANSSYLSREDEPGLSITGNLTLGCWVYFDFQSTGRIAGIINKWYDVGNQRSYALYKTAGGALTFSVSNDGATVYSVSDMGVNYRESQWFYVVGRLTASLEIAIFVNGIWYINDTIVPASIYNSTSDFEIGRFNGSNYLDGRISQAFICAYSVPSTFVCAMFAHARALYMNKLVYNNPCSEVIYDPALDPGYPGY